MTIGVPHASRRLLESANTSRRLLIGIAMILCSSTSMAQQERPLVIAGITEHGISLIFEVKGLTYSKRGTIVIRYEVKNKGKQDIYLIKSEALVPGYELKKKELSGDFSKNVVGYDFFELPKLERIRPGKGYESQASLSLDYLKDHFSTGDWFLYLSIGYVDNQGMTEIREQRERFPLGVSPRLFERLQKVVQAGPIKLDLVE
jgi:hypothetical protein